MKHITTTILISFVMLAFFNACDKVKPPYTKTVKVDTTSLKVVLCEEGTSTYCENCPKGACTIEKMIAQYPNNFIPVAYHSSMLGPDPMHNSAFDVYDNVYANNNGLPCVVIDRKTMVSYPADYNSVLSEYSTEMTKNTPVTMSIIDITCNSGTGVLSYTVQAKVLSEMQGNYGFNSILTEDSVHGKGASWYQENIFSGEGANAMCEFGTLANPIPDSLMYYNHVARYISDGWNGAVGSIPTDNDKGAILTKPYNVTVPSAWNAAHINIVGFIINQTDSTIVNACQAVHVGR
ncbi:MAG: Omp28-related outer membrane protein [Bacteroidales bacterium]